MQTHVDSMIDQHQAAQLNGTDVVQHLETGQPATFNTTETVILTHMVVYFLLLSFKIVVSEFYKLKADPVAAKESPIIGLVNKIQDSLRFLPMLLVLLVFSLLRGKVDLENSTIQPWAASAAIATVYIVLVQMCVTAFSIKYGAKMKQEAIVTKKIQSTTTTAGTGKNASDRLVTDDDVVEEVVGNRGPASCIQSKTIVVILECLRIALHASFVVVVVVIVAGIMDNSKTLPDVPPPARGDPVVLL